MLKLSKDFATRLYTVAALPTDQRKDLIANLDKIPYGFDFEEGVSAAISASGIDKSNSENLARAIISLHYLHGNAGLDQAQFVEELLAAIIEAQPEKDIQDNKGNLEAALLEFLGTAPLRVSAKAATLLFDEERGFSNARVITDVRPVFGDDISSPDISAAFIIHSLRISYRGRSENSEFFVSMSTKDLRDLRKVIDRALDKAEGLEHVMSSLTSHVIDPK